MTKKKIPQTIEECNAELERTQKLLQQYENRNKMLNRKLSVEKRKERNHRIFLFGGFMESIVPELKTMTEDEGKDFLYHIAKSMEAQEYLKKRAEGVEAGYYTWQQGRTYTHLRACALCRGLISAQGDFTALRYGGFAATRGCTPCAASRLSLHTHKNSTPAVGVCTIFAGFIILSGR